MTLKLLQQIFLRNTVDCYYLKAFVLLVFNTPNSLAILFLSIKSFGLYHASWRWFYYFKNLVNNNIERICSTYLSKTVNTNSEAQFIAQRQDAWPSSSGIAGHFLRLGRGQPYTTIAVSGIATKTSMALSALGDPPNSYSRSRTAGYSWMYVIPQDM